MKNKNETSTYFEKLRRLSEVERLLVGVIGSFEKSRLDVCYYFIFHTF